MKTHVAGPDTAPVPAKTAKRPTIRDVAAASEVSPATVSFVLNDSQDQTISAATRQRVLDAAQRLGYTPHGIAKALAEGASRIVVLNVSSGLPGNYARSYTAGLDDELSKHGYVLLVRHDHAAADDTRVIDAINPKAVLEFGAAYTTGHELKDSGGGWRDGLAAHSAVQIRHLAESGHREIAFALPDTPALIATPRRQFANSTALSLGLSKLAVLVVPSDRGAAAEAIRSLRSARPNLTAVAALDDGTAVQVLAAAGDLGLQMPQELAVIGYDDAGYGAYSTPTLTTIHIDAEAHGRISARQVLDLGHGDLVIAPGSVLVRESA